MREVFTRPCLISSIMEVIVMNKAQTPISWGAVSYTHLDVYKRQVYPVFSLHISLISPATNPIKRAIYIQHTVVLCHFRCNIFTVAAYRDIPWLQPKHNKVPILYQRILHGNLAKIIFKNSG